jgi:hypothetical protein
MSLLTIIDYAPRRIEFESEKWWIGDYLNYKEKASDRLPPVMPLDDKQLCALYDTTDADGFVDGQKLFGKSFPAGVKVLYDEITGAQDAEDKCHVGKQAIVFRFDAGNAHFILFEPIDESGRATWKWCGQPTPENYSQALQMFRLYAKPEQGGA